MMRIVVLVAAVMPCWSVAGAQHETSILPEPAKRTTTEPFDPSWESLDKYECPEWFRDAKLGIFVCWNLHSLQGTHDWYAHRMYLEGDAVYKHHVKTYGHPSTFGFKDFIPMWKAQKFDADDLVRHTGNCYVRVPTTYYASYMSLAPKYGIWKYATADDKRYRDTDLESTPGKVGARASKLFAILERGHYDVKLSEEELHRITVWLDSYSPFYGVYEPEAGKAQLRGEVVRPVLE